MKASVRIQPYLEISRASHALEDWRPGFDHHKLRDLPVILCKHQRLPERTTRHRCWTEESAS